MLREHSLKCLGDHTWCDALDQLEAVCVQGKHLTSCTLSLCILILFASTLFILQGLFLEVPQGSAVLGIRNGALYI